MPLFEDDPRTRRLRADYDAMKQLKQESTIVDFIAHGDPPERYVVTFKGKGTKRKSETDPVEVVDIHRCEIQLGIDYPRSQPYLKWATEIYHPNIAVSGAVCLGGYSTNWSPALGLDELCEMLWDMIRYANYDTESPYNYRAAQWAKTQKNLVFPLDSRSLKDGVGQKPGGNVITFDIPVEPKEPPKVEPRPEPPKPVEPVRVMPQPVNPPVAQVDDISFVEDTTPIVPPRIVAPRPYKPPAPSKPKDDEGIEFV